ncbi:hypothetical protein Hanom_Chr11g01026011 [Helianthus anomalus]
MRHGDIPYKAVWDKEPLNKLPAELQPKLFYDKMGDDHFIKENMCFEKSVLAFKGNPSREVYVKSVVEWMSTLTKDDGSNPPRTTTLNGKVNNKPITLSPVTLRQLSKFNSKADNVYRVKDFNDYYLHTEKLVVDNLMLSELLMIDKGLAMKRDNLKPIVHLLLSFMITNVTPSTGDRMAIRK